MFFITGLPRSRTAWTATFLSTLPSTYCHHDGLRGCRNLDEYAAKIAYGVPAVHVGDCDSALLYCWREVRDIFPEAKWVVLLRPLLEVQESMIRTRPYRGMTREQWQQAIDSLSELNVELNSLRYALNPKEIQVSELSTLEAAYQLCKSIGVTFFDERYEAMQHRKCNAVGVWLNIERYEAMQHRNVQAQLWELDPELEKLRELLEDVAKRRERSRSSVSRDPI
jgi:flagellar biosynthesis chaperone FliJ